MNQSQRIGPYIYLINSMCFLMITLVACSISKVDTKSLPSNGNQFSVKAILTHLPELDLSHHPQTKSESLQAYSHFYGLDYYNASHFMGYFQSEDKTIWGQVFFPVRPVGTIFLIHGYFDHSGTLKNLIADSLKNGFVVAVFDLPGHGLSSGERGAIGSFSEYVTVLQTFINKCSEYLPTPFHLIAHSTGCSIAYEYLNQTEWNFFKKIVFLAPLVHNNHWLLSSVGYNLAKPFTDKLRRTYRRNSSDEQFLKFSRNDPLQNSYLSIRFLDAFHEWNRKIMEYGTISNSMLVIQGTDDIVVDWEYNLIFLKSKIIEIEVEYIGKANHQLTNESTVLKQQVFDRIFEYMDE